MSKTKIPEWAKTAVSFLIIGFVIATPFIWKPAINNKEPFYLPVFSETLKIGDQTLKIAYAGNDKTREQGLSFTKSLAENHGMLFIFDRQETPGFWMKDMNYPLDIIWIDENKTVIGISENIMPETFPEKFYPDKPVKYALELNAGFANLHNLTVGTVLDF